MPEDDIDFKESARMSEDEIIEIAESIFTDKPNYCAERIGRYVGIELRKGKLIWTVRYALVDKDGLPTRSGHTIYEIDDEIGEIIKTFYAPH